MPLKQLDFPDAAYDNDPQLKIQLRFVTPRTVRVTMLTSPIEPKEDDANDVMLAGVPKTDNSWRVSQTSNAISYSSEFGTIEIQKYPWRIVVKDAKGKILTQSRSIIDNDSSQVKLLPFAFIKRGSDNSRSINPVFNCCRLPL